ncbi:MAG: tetratricopeptide repeat protein, partial [Planctomycetota bacterium]
SLLQIRAQIESTDERGDFAVALAAAETLAKLTEHGNDELQLLVRIFSDAGSSKKVEDPAKRGGYLRAAIAFALQLITKNPENAGLYRNVANLFKGIHQYSKAIGAFEAGLKLDPKDQQMAADCAELLRRRGLVHFSKGRKAEARKDLERAFELATVSEKSFAWRALQQLREQEALPPAYTKLLAEARAFLEQQQPEYARVKAAEAGRLRRTRDLFILMGDISLALGNAQEAADFWADAVKQLWDDALVVKLGRTLWDDGHRSEAVEQVRALYARLLDPRDGELAKAWMAEHTGVLAREALDEGVAHLKGAGGAEPGAKPDPEALADAERAFRLAIQLRKDDPRGHFGLAQTCALGGAKTEAVKHFQKVIALTKDDPAEAAQSLNAQAKQGLARLK